MAHVVDQQNTSGTIGIGFGDVGNGRDYMAQGFILGTGITNISAIAFYLNGKSGNSNQGYRVWIDNADASSHPTGSIGGIGGDTLITNAQLTTGALTQYILSSPVTGLTPGNRYCFVVAPWNTSTNVYSSDYQDFRSSVSNPYANGRRTHGNTAYNSWGDPDSGNADLQFRTYYDDSLGASTIKKMSSVLQAQLKKIMGATEATVKKIMGATN